MRYSLSLTIMFLTFVLLVAVCGNRAGDNGEYPYAHYEDDKMIGTVWEVNKSQGLLEVDISEWEKRDRKGPNMDGEGYSYIAQLSAETVIQHEDGTEASIEDIKVGQKVLVNPPRGKDFKGYLDEIILLEMSYEEKYSQLLSHREGFNIVVMFETGKNLPHEMRESMYENVMNILDEKEYRAGASWVEYNKDYIVDYKDEFEIEHFPIILVFDQEELLYKTDDVDELYNFFKNLEG